MYVRSRFHWPTHARIRKRSPYLTMCHGSVYRRTMPHPTKQQGTQNPRLSASARLPCGCDCCEDERLWACPNDLRFGSAIQRRGGDCNVEGTERFQFEANLGDERCLPCSKELLFAPISMSQDPTSLFCAASCFISSLISVLRFPALATCVCSSASFKAASSNKRVNMRSDSSLIYRSLHSVCTCYECNSMRISTAEFIEAPGQQPCPGLFWLPTPTWIPRAGTPTPNFVLASPRPDDA